MPGSWTALVPVDSSSSAEKPSCYRSQGCRLKDLELDTDAQLTSLEYQLSLWNGEVQCFCKGGWPWRRGGCEGERTHPGGDRRTPGRERIFLALGVLQLGCAVALLGVYVSQRLLTSSTQHLEVLPSYVTVAVVAVCGLAVLVLFCKRIPVLVWLCVGVCMATGGLCLGSLVLTGTLVVRPLRSVLHCAYDASLRQCQCASAYLRSGLDIQYSPTAPTTLVFADAESCGLVESALLPTLYVLLVVQSIALLLAVLCAAIVLKAHCVHRALKHRLQDDAYEEIFTVSNGSTSPSCDSDNEHIFSPRPILSPSRTRTEVIRGYAGQSLEGGQSAETVHPLASGIRRCQSFHQPRTADSGDEEDGTPVYENTEAARALNLPSLALEGGGGRLKEHRRRSRRAVTLHNLDTRQLMLILSLQMRYLQEAESSKTQAKLGTEDPTSQAANPPQSGRRGSLESSTLQSPQSSLPSDRQPATLPLDSRGQGPVPAQDSGNRMDGSRGGEDSRGLWMGGQGHQAAERLGPPSARERSRTPSEGLSSRNGRSNPGMARRSLTPQPGYDATLPLRHITDASLVMGSPGRELQYENAAALQALQRQTVQSPRQQEVLRQDRAVAGPMEGGIALNQLSSRRESTPPERDCNNRFGSSDPRPKSASSKVHHYEEIDDVATYLERPGDRHTDFYQQQQRQQTGNMAEAWVERDLPHHMHDGQLSSRAETYMVPERDSNSRKAVAELGDSGPQNLYAQLPAHELRRLGCETPSRPKSFMSAVDKSESPHTSQTGLHGNGTGAAVPGREGGELGYPHAGGSGPGAGLSSSVVQDIYAQPVRKNKPKNPQQQYSNRDKRSAVPDEAGPVNAQLFTSVVPPTMVNGSASPRLPRNENERSAFYAVGRNEEDRSRGHGDGHRGHSVPNQSRLDTGDESWDVPRRASQERVGSHNGMTFIHSPMNGKPASRKGYLPQNSPHHSHSSLQSGSSPHHSQHSLLSQNSPHHSHDSLLSQNSPRFSAAHPAQSRSHHSTDHIAMGPHRDAEAAPRNPKSKRGALPPPPPPPPPPLPPYSPPPAYLEIQSNSQGSSLRSSASDASESDTAGDIYRQVDRSDASGSRQLQRQPSGTFPGSRHQPSSAHGNARVGGPHRTANYEAANGRQLYRPGLGESPREYHTLDLAPGQHVQEGYREGYPHQPVKEKFAPNQNSRLEERKHFRKRDEDRGMNHVTSYVYEDHNGFSDSLGPSVNIVQGRSERIYENGRGGYGEEMWRNPGGKAPVMQPHHFDSLDDVFDPSPRSQESNSSRESGAGLGSGRQLGREMIHYGNILHLDHSPDSDSEATEMETVI